MKKWLWLPLLCLVLTGCQEAEKPETALPPVTQIEAPGPAKTDDFYFRYETQPLPGGLELATAQCAADGLLYTGGLTGTAPGLYVQDEAGTETALPLPEDAEYLYAAVPWEDGCAVLYGSRPAQYQDGAGSVIFTEDPENRHALAFYDSSHGLDHVTPLRETYDTSLGSFRDMAVTEAGFVLLHPDHLVLVDPDGAQLAELPLEAEELAQFLAVAQSTEGLFVLKQDYDSGVTASLLELDPATLEIQSEALLEREVCGLGTDAGGALLLNVPGDDGGVYRREADGSLHPQLAWADAGGSLEGRKLLTLKESTVLFKLYETALERVRRMEGPRPEPEQLTLAYTGQTQIVSLVRLFNRSQQDYQVTATAYTDADMTRLKTEILAGKWPDLFCFGSMSSISGLELGGLRPEIVCADLGELLDTQIPRETFVPLALEAVKIDGGYYTLPLNFCIATVVAPSDLLPEQGLTLAELEEVLDRAGDLLPFESWMFAENLLGLTCEFYLSRYVDREAGTCDFESQEFYDYLTWCKTWSGDGTIADTPQESLLHYIIVGNPEYIITRRADGEPRNRTYVGFPVEEGYGHELYVPTQIGIAAGTGHRTGAEAFVRFCVEEYPALTDQDMPATAADLEAIIDRCARGEAVDWDGTALVLDEAAYDQFQQLLENTTVVAETDTTMREIVTDEAAYFFAGERTAEETAALIQQRVSLYLLEQQEAP